MKYNKQDQADAKERLMDWVKPGDTVYTVLRQHSRSGMSRRISLVLPPPERGGYFLQLDYNVETLLGYAHNKDESAIPWVDGVKVGGCGMDMGFHLVYELASELYGDGYALKHRWI